MDVRMRPPHRATPGKSPDWAVRGEASLIRQPPLEIPLVERVGFQNPADWSDLGLYAVRSYSLMRPPRMGRRLIRSWVRLTAGRSERGGCNCSARWGRLPL